MASLVGKIGQFAMIIFLVMAGVCQCGWAEQRKDNLVVAYDQWPPFTDQDDPNRGLCFALLQAIFANSNFSIEPRVLPFKRIELYLRKGEEIDASPYVWYNRERAKYLRFSDPLLYNRVYFYVRKDSTITYNRLEDLQHLTIAVIRGYYNGEEFDNAEYLDKNICNTNEQAIKMLVMGRVDMAVLDSIVAENLMQKLKLEGTLKKLPTALLKTALYFVVSLKNPQGEEIINAFNRGLRRIKANNQYETIMKSYGVTEQTGD